MTEATQKKIEEAAWRGSEMPDGLDPLEQIYFHGMSFIFHNYRIKEVNADTVKLYRQSLLIECEQLRQEAMGCAKKGGNA